MCSEYLLDISTGRSIWKADSESNPCLYDHKLSRPYHQPAHLGLDVQPTFLW